ncbi:uncharacterized protein LOC111251909 [Varroa destructor]|uniref:Uncharacterized protein n=1 Tax=Varroa destructor TaxID=109461 RepID=A0A7M7KF54_VARDE|nr:uncharacterized protein LOC111251909 [Varroa destructor]
MTSLDYQPVPRKGELRKHFRRFCHGSYGQVHSTLLSSRKQNTLPLSDCKRFCRSAKMQRKSGLTLKPRFCRRLETHVYVAVGSDKRDTSAEDISRPSCQTFLDFSGIYICFDLVDDAIWAAEMFKSADAV